MAKKKKPASTKIPHVADPGVLYPAKRPATAVSVASILDMHPSWRLSLLDMDGPFGWDGLSGEELREIRGKLVEYEGLMWREIKVEQADRNHLISIQSMAPEAQNRLRKVLPGVDELFSLRLTGKGRIFGIIQERGVMLVVWWDSGHRVCPVKK